MLFSPPLHARWFAERKSERAAHRISALLRNGYNLKLPHSIKNPSVLRKTLKHWNGNNLKAEMKVQQPSSSQVWVTPMSLSPTPASKAASFFSMFLLLTEALFNLSRKISLQACLWTTVSRWGESGCQHLRGIYKCLNTCVDPSPLAFPNKMVKIYACLHMQRC